MSQITGKIPKRAVIRMRRRALARKGVLGLGLLALLLSSGLLGLWFMTRGFETAASLINLCGKQRMLIQRAWALELALISAPGSQDALRLRASLLAVAGQMEKSHAGLKAAFSRLGPRRTSADTLDLLYGGENNLDSQITAFSLNIRRFANLPDSALERGNPLHAGMRREMANGRLLITLEATTQSFQNQNAADAAAFRVYAGAFFLLVMAALVLLAVWLFLPFYRRIEEEAERLNLAVEERTAQLTRAYQEAKAEAEARKAAEENLRRSQQKLRLVLGGLPVIVSAADEKGIFTLSEGKGLEAIGRTPGEVVGLSVEEAHGANSALAEAFNRARMGDNSETILQTGGRTFHFKVRPRISENGLSAGAIGVGMDITEKVQAENEARLAQKRLLHADKMKSLGMLVAGVAHEINNPNGYIMLNVSLLERMCGAAISKLKEALGPGDYLIPGELTLRAADEAVPKLFAGLADGSSRICDIVNRLKNFARPDFDPPKTAVDVNQAVESALRLTWNAIKSSTGKFSKNLAECIPPVLANRVELEQVLVNLITNACQALTNPAQGITVSTGYDPEARMTSITVYDEGRGVPAEVKEMITEPFFTTRRESGGLGLGLSVSHNIVSRCGGILEFDSVEGSYTKATVLIPALDPDDAAAEFPPWGKEGG